jgi:hypothetical protein
MRRFSTAHLPQSLLPALMFFPQPLHTRSGLGIATVGAAKLDLLLAGVAALGV